MYYLLLLLFELPTCLLSCVLRSKHQWLGVKYDQLRFKLHDDLFFTQRLFALVAVRISAWIPCVIVGSALMLPK